MARYVALLRGINVGGNKRIAMADLRSLCEGLGFEHARTLLQSGNVVLDSRVSAPTPSRRGCPRRSSRSSGWTSAWWCVPRAELAAVVEHDPFGAIADPLKYYSVSFLGVGAGAGRARGYRPGRVCTGAVRAARP